MILNANFRDPRHFSLLENNYTIANQTVTKYKTTVDISTLKVTIISRVNGTV